MEDIISTDAVKLSSSEFRGCLSIEAFILHLMKGTTEFIILYAPLVTPYRVSSMDCHYCTLRCTEGGQEASEILGWHAEYSMRQN